MFGVRSCGRCSTLSARVDCWGPGRSLRSCWPTRSPGFPCLFPGSGTRGGRQTTHTTQQRNRNASCAEGISCFQDHNVAAERARTDTDRHTCTRNAHRTAHTGNSCRPSSTTGNVSAHLLILVAGDVCKAVAGGGVGPLHWASGLVALGAVPRATSAARRSMTRSAARRWRARCRTSSGRTSCAVRRAPSSAGSLRGVAPGLFRRGRLR